MQGQPTIAATPASARHSPYDGGLGKDPWSGKFQTPTNRFKQAMAQRQAQIGLWLGLADAYSARSWRAPAMTGCWSMANTRPTTCAPSCTSCRRWPVRPAPPAPCRPGRDHPARRTGAGGGHRPHRADSLDLGVQTLLVPMVDAAEGAQQLVRATRYAPKACAAWAVRWPARRAGRRTRSRLVTRPTSRSACWCRPNGGGHEQPGRHCCHARRGRRVHRPGGPQASMGHPAVTQTCPEVQAAIHDGIAPASCARAEPAPDILATAEYAGATPVAGSGRAVFVAVGVDTMLLASAAQDLLARFGAEAAHPGRAATGLLTPLNVHPLLTQSPDHNDSMTMKACIYGAGAIGGWLGVALAQAGHPVSLVARGETSAPCRTPGPAHAAHRRAR